MGNVSPNSSDNISLHINLPFGYNNNGSNSGLQPSQTVVIPVQTTLSSNINNINQNYIQYSQLPSSNPSQTISNPLQTQPQIIQLPQLPQLQLNNNYNSITNGIIYNADSTNGCIQLPYGVTSVNNVNLYPSLTLTIPNIPSNILQNHNANTNTLATLHVQPSEISLPTISSVSSIPTIPILNTLPSSELYSMSINTIDCSSQVNITTNMQKAKPLTKSQYKINDNGTFQCLITDKQEHKVCNKIFAHRSSLTRHTNLVHDNYKPFKCKFKGCNKIFGRSHLLKLHTRIHSGEKPYKCPDKHCNKAFKQRAHLMQHFRAHTGEKPYRCSFCGTQFRHKSVRDTHFRVHTGEKPFQCKLCGKDFSHYTSFWRHKRNKICLKKKRNKICLKKKEIKYLT